MTDPEAEELARARLIAATRAAAAAGTAARARVIPIPSNRALKN